MSDKLLHILCSCRQGELEEIASTEASLGLLNWEGPDQVIFYECPACKKIFQRYGFILRGNNQPYNGNGFCEFSEIIPYNGDLTKKEIIENIPNLIGCVYREDIDRIKAQREKQY